MKITTTIFVYKTNIRLTRDVQRIKQLFNNQLNILKWNVDREDVDCVLRVVSNENNADAIAAMVRAEGYDCTELS